jgi:predicted alpha/beta-hydrolase family hydrolase
MAERIEAPGIRGWLHRPEKYPHAALAITHGAGSNCEAPLLVAVSDAFSMLDWVVLRYDLPYRLAGSGPPRNAAIDQEGIRLVSTWMRQQYRGPVFLGGHSYGGRQTSMLAAQDPSVADALLLLSYPLHPPKQPEKLRTEHFPALRVPVLFVHGTRDEFATLGELENARMSIPAATAIMSVEKQPHGLNPKLAPEIASAFATFTREWFSESVSTR